MPGNRISRADAERDIKDLVDRLTGYERAYYREGRSLVSDSEYDRLFDTLRRYEETFPDLRLPDSPTQRVGSDLGRDLPEVEHHIPVLSLDKVYSPEELVSWKDRTLSRLPDYGAGILCEEKIDGVSIVVYYEDGVLERGVTRGNGRVGNDVTHNIRTIRSVPLRLPEPLTVAVRGEVFLRRADFAHLNDQLETPFANPRNLAAGTVRRVRSLEAAAIPLQFFSYDVYGLDGIHSHHQALMRLHELGLPVNPRCAWIHTASADPAALQRFTHMFPDAVVGGVEHLHDYIQQEIRQRNNLGYEIDGLVAKLDDITARESLGYTGHHPRWAVALKFDAPQGVSVIRGIDVQVGRTGRITPVARIEPVRIGGSMVQNVTLHNQEYITGLELTVGDTVAVSKRGDVIPAVEQVLEKGPGDPPVWQIREDCPACGTALVVRGAHHFCPNTFGCPDQQRARLRFFVGRNQMDIDGLGSETLETLIRMNMVQDIPDLYEADYGRLRNEAGFGEKKIQHIRTGIEDSKSRPYRQVLPSLGIPEVGPKVTQLLCEGGVRSIDHLMQIAEQHDTEQLSAIHGIGEKTAQVIIREVSSPQLQKTISRLRAHGLNFSEQEPVSGNRVRGYGVFSGQTWCITGSFETFQPRSAAAAEIERRGGNVTGSVSGKTTHLLAGSSPGSKYDKAVSQGVRVVDEHTFLQMLQESSD